MDGKAVTMIKRASTVLLLSSLALGLGACAGVETKPPEVTRHGKKGQGPEGRLFGEGGFSLMGDDKNQDQGGPGIGVNAFLWRATLDTLAFMPLSSADPFGGVIITEWYAPPETPNERFKVTAYIMDRQLRADGIRVSVFREEKQGGEWRQMPVDEDMATKLENAILERARELRAAQAAS